MRMELFLILQLGILLFLASDSSVQASTGFSSSPSSTTLFTISSPKTAPGPANHSQPSSTYNTPASSSQPNGSVLVPPPLSPSPTALPPSTSKTALAPQSESSPLDNLSPNPFNFQGQAPSIAPSEAQRKTPPIETPPFSVAPAPLESPSKNLPQYPPSRSPTSSMASPPTVDVGNTAPIPEPLAPEQDIPPSTTTSPTPAKKSIEVPASAPSMDMPKDSPPANANDDPYKGPSPAGSTKDSHYAHPPFSSFNPPVHQTVHRPTLSPAISYTKHHHSRSKISSPLPAPSYPVSSRAPSVSPTFLPGIRTKDHSPTPLDSRIPPFHSFPPPPMHALTPHPSQKIPFGAAHVPVSPPKVSPPTPLKYGPKTPLLPPLKPFPPPPPNPDCLGTICKDPYTNTPPNSPCACVLPIQVGLRLGIDLYTFFPLVSELAKEISISIFLKQSQVRIIGASAANQQAEKTVVLIHLVPLEEKFDSTTALLTYQRFWLKQVSINAFFFGDYEVLYVQYPGLPPSPPGAPIIHSQPYLGNNSNNNNGRTIKPIGVDVHSKRHIDRLNSGMITIIALSSILAVVFCIAFAWILVFGQRDCLRLQKRAPDALLSSVSKPSGMAGSTMGSMRSSVSLSLESNMATYMGSAKTFSANDMKKATNNFDDSRILGEGGFGRVYSGVLEDGTKVAVKVLKREDHHGGQEFCAEVEMLSRLHHRNLVKLIGICTEDHIRCLVYELIPNGSVESHLHGVDEEKAPLDWTTRMKIALGAARGLAYLHEDSSPRVIHRDFKASNILLEWDFTPKVSDFGLARTAMDEESRHISTRVMGTFGYVAPEYAMTGHLLVKSDVYSYGVVLLELLTGRKPVDMSQPPGRENLVAWARSLLTSREGLESIIDKSLSSNAPFDSIAKVAAIASMCVQPEVTNRPFMGEVVQALKLVCNECDEKRKSGSRGSSWEEVSIDVDAGPDSRGSRQFRHSFYGLYSPANFDNGVDSETRLSISDLLSSSARFQMQESRLLQRQSSSGPLSSRRGRPIWKRMRFSSESVSESEFNTRFWPGSN